LITTLITHSSIKGVFYTRRSKKTHALKNSNKTGIFSHQNFQNYKIRGLKITDLHAAKNNFENHDESTNFVKLCVGRFKASMKSEFLFLSTRSAIWPHCSFVGSTPEKQKKLRLGTTEVYRHEA
jgi:hypothetical protein